MELIKECLDEKLVDRSKRPMGRVDGIILESEPGRPPRVAYIEVGVLTNANRLSLRLGRLVKRLERRASLTREPYRIPWSRLRIGLNEVTADVEAEETPALELELWLRKNIIGRIPGA